MRDAKLRPLISVTKPPCGLSFYREAAICYGKRVAVTLSPPVLPSEV